MSASYSEPRFFLARALSFDLVGILERLRGKIRMLCINQYTVNNSTQLNVIKDPDKQD
jgi:hypothetical protein